jgi:hypothetical protein
MANEGKKKSQAKANQAPAKAKKSKKAKAKPASDSQLPTERVEETFQPKDRKKALEVAKAKNIKGIRIVKQKIWESAQHLAGYLNFNNVPDFEAWIEAEGLFLYQLELISPD